MLSEGMTSELDPNILGNFIDNIDFCQLEKICNSYDETYLFGGFA